MQYAHHLGGVLHHLRAQQGRVRPHAHYILIIIIVGNAVQVHGVAQRLALGGGGGGCELRSLQPVVHPQLAKIDKRGKDTIYPVVHKVVQLPLRQHGHAHHHHLELIHGQRHRIAVEIPAMHHIVQLWANERIVAHRVEFAYQSLFYQLYGMPHRAEYLGYAPQRVVGLHLMGEVPIGRCIVKLCSPIAQATRAL